MKDLKQTTESDVDEASTKEKIENSDKLKATEISLNALDYQQNNLSKNWKDKTHDESETAKNEPSIEINRRWWWWWKVKWNFRIKFVFEKT